MGTKDVFEPRKTSFTRCDLQPFPGDFRESCLSGLKDVFQNKASGPKALPNFFAFTFSGGRSGNVYE
jgi:hypothetical protein